MFPSFTFLGQVYPTFSLLGLLALIIASRVAYVRFKGLGLSYTDMMFGLVFFGAGLLVGGHILFALLQVSTLWENKGYLFSDPISFFSFAFGGMVFYGGLIGALAVIPFYAKLMRLNLSEVVAVVIPVFPLAHGIMRIGCFLAGCCYGIEHEMLGVVFTRSLSAPNGIPLLPVQLYEAAGNFIIFAKTWLYSKKREHPICILCLYVLSYAVMRFMLEFLRGDAVRGFIGPMSTSQFISILIIVVCIFALIYIPLRNPDREGIL